MDTKEIKGDYVEEGMWQMHILMLNEYCLLELFSYLSIEEVFRMEEVCTRFQEISQRIYLSTRKLNIIELYQANLTIPDVKKIISCVGPHIHTLLVDECTIKAKKGEIPRFIPYNIDVFDLEVEHDEEDEAFVFKSLKKAHLVYCEVADEQLSYLLPLEQLEVFCFQEIGEYNTNGQFLKSLKNITEIDLAGLVCLDSNVFKEFCEATPNLRSLNLDCTNLYPNDVKAIATNLKNLETLTISNDNAPSMQEDFRHVADLPKLKNLELIEYNEEDNEVDDFIDFRQFLLLVSHHNRLETLCYVGNVGLLENTDSIHRPLTNLTNLKKFTMKFYHADSLFVENVLENFTAKHKLEELIIRTTMGLTSQPLEMLIKRCPTIRLIDLTDNVKRVKMNFLNNLRECLSKRFHVLKIKLTKAQQKECADVINGSHIKNLRLVFV